MGPGIRKPGDVLQLVQSKSDTATTIATGTVTITSLTGTISPSSAVRDGLGGALELAPDRRQVDRQSLPLTPLDPAVQRDRAGGVRVVERQTSWMKDSQLLHQRSGAHFIDQR